MQRNVTGKRLTGKDPYELPLREWQDNIDLWPSITYIDVGMYLLFSVSFYTQEELKNYKSMESYRRFLDGWVREVLVQEFGDDRLMIAKVNHSQKMSEKPLVPWILSDKDGKIWSAHCNCMAGLGESCSHVASLLWAVEAGVKSRNSQTVTQKKAYWVMPSAVKAISYQRVKDIKFAKNKKERKPFRKRITPPSEYALTTFYEELSKCKSKPSVLSVVKPFAEKYTPQLVALDLPSSMSDLFDKRYLSEGLDLLLQVSKEKLPKYQVSSEKRDLVESNTKDQAKSRLWHRFRTGRVTASKFKAVCVTKVDSPSKSLTCSICYPELARFRTEGTKWGIKKESTARAEYGEKQTLSHKDFKLTTCGLIISTDKGYLAASPDGLVQCSCCGLGLCEIKCPFNHKGQRIEDCLKDSKFCLEKNKDCKIQLKRNHEYYYQVQLQLFCSERHYGDFIVWTERDMFVERINVDKKMMTWLVTKVEKFVTYAVLPELIGKWYTRSTSSQHVPAPCTSSTQSPGEREICICRQPKSGTIVNCSNAQCKIKTFHLLCVAQDDPTNRKAWYCSQC